MIVSEILSYLQTELLSVANMEKAIGMKGYMKNRFEFLGVASPIRKDIIKHSFKLFTIKSEAELFEVITTLWQLPYREYQYTALEYLYKYNKLISENSLAKFEYYIVTKSWWDTVDGLGADAVGHYFSQFPEYQEQQIDLWLNSGNIWLQRVCIIHQLFYKEYTDTSLLIKCVLHCKDSNEFFIQKSIGWVLRQYAKTDADFVKEFVNTNQLKPLSKREALKHF